MVVKTPKEKLAIRYSGGWFHSKVIGTTVVITACHFIQVFHIYCACLNEGIVLSLAVYT